MHLCTGVSEEEGDGVGAGSEALSLLSLDTHRGRWPDGKTKKLTVSNGMLILSLMNPISRKSSPNYALYDMREREKENLACIGRSWWLEGREELSPLAGSSQTEPPTILSIHWSGQ